MLTSSRKFWLTSTLTSSSSLMLIESSLMLWQMSDLILMLETDKQLHYVRSSDSEAEDLIWVLLLQVIIQSKIRLTADNLVLFRETFSFSQETMFSDIFINEFMLYSNFNVSKKKSSILNLIKDAQEFDLLCR